MAMNLKYDQLFFDLDGTLNDSAPGICRSMQYALEQLGQPVPDEADLRWVVGPPIGDNFRSILQSDDPQLIERGIHFFRERYLPIGKLEASLYDGVVSMLEQLSAYQGRMRILTSKLEDFAHQIAEHFAIKDFFNGIHGSHADKQHTASDSKAARLALLLENEDYDPTRCVMIGDREYDIEAAKSNGVHAVGVSYGYGSVSELEHAGADIILATPQAVADYLLADN